MIDYRTGIDAVDWASLYALYELTDGVIGLARDRQHDRIEKAFRASYKIITAWNDDEIVGCARMISDGQCYGWVHDVAVHPNFRRMAIGSELMHQLMSNEDHLLVGLTSSFEAVDFYRSLDFKKHKTAMALYPGSSSYLED